MYLERTHIFAVWGGDITFKVWDIVKYEDTAGNEFCPKSLYMFTYILIPVLGVIWAICVVCGLLAKIFTFIYNVLCCRPCQEAEEHQQHA